MPIFYDLYMSLNVKPLKETEEPKFKAINFGEFLKKELGASYEKHKNNHDRNILI